MEKNEIFNLDNKNLYEILEIPIFSSQHIIKKSFKKLALKYHPDKNTTNTDNTSNYFIKIKNAYDILSDEKLKQDYDEQIKFINIINFKFTNDNNFIFFFKNFIITTEFDKIIIILLKKYYEKKQIKNENKILNLINITNHNPIDIIYNLIILINTIDNSYKLCDYVSNNITNINIEINFDLKDVWEIKPKFIKFPRVSKFDFEEILYPIDFKQIYENEGNEIIINSIKYVGDLIIKINIINTKYKEENYFVYDDELYIIINNNRIIENKFIINFLDDNNYKFNINKLKKINKKIGDVYFKKNFGFKKYNDNGQNQSFDQNILNGNLYFIIL